MTSMPLTRSPDQLALTPEAPPAKARAILSAALRAGGVVQGDIVWIQACGEPLESLLGDDRERMCRTIEEAVREVVGPEGTLLVPAFTFSFPAREAFDPATSSPRSGKFHTLVELSSHLQRMPGAVRSRDPIFSVVGQGPRVSEMLGDLPSRSFGAGSVHDRLRRAGGKLVLVGVGLDEAVLRHSVEAAVRVPWRYDKLFTGHVVEDGRTVKEGWIYNVRILASNGDPAAEHLAAAALDAGIGVVFPFGDSTLTVAPAREYHDFLVGELRRDPWCSARGPAVDPAAAESARVGGGKPVVTLPGRASMRQMVDALWRLPRHIVSDGYDAALEALATQVPMTIHEYPTGSEAWTWIIPEKWGVREAYLETMDGRRLFSTADHPLHVVSYSLPFDGVVSREELLRHLHVHPRLPDAVPFIFKYYDRDWGLCCSQAQRDALTDDEYRVRIDSHFSFGSLKVGEVVVPGESDETIVLCAHLCHPGMVNDDLTGVVVGVDVIRSLLERRDLRYSYRLVIVPETIGSAAYLSGHEELIPRMKGGVFLEMLGKPLPHALQRSFTGTTEVDRCFELAMRREDPDGWSSAFRTIIGNDERQYNAPGVRVPMLSLSRVQRTDHPEYPYREYHSSHDTPDVVSWEHLERSRDLVLRMIDTLEANRVPQNEFRGEVFCARYGIHVDWYTNPEGHRALFEVMYLIDGTRSVADIAEACGISFEAVRLTLEELRRHGLVSYR